MRHWVISAGTQDFGHFSVRSCTGEWLLVMVTPIDLFIAVPLPPLSVLIFWLNPSFCRTPHEEQILRVPEL